MPRLPKLVAAVLCCLLLAAPTVAVADGLSLSVQSIDAKSAQPKVTARVSLPAEMTGEGAGKPAFTVTENGRDVGDVSVTTVRADAVPAYSVLVIDTSGSMQGKPLEDAKQAAARFVDALGGQAQVAIVAFADEPKIVSGFTSDRTQLQAAIDSLQASGETAVYDALVASSLLVPQMRDARRSIVLLSDGSDTVSSASLAKAISMVKRSGAPVYAVALKSSEFNPKALGFVAKDSGGRLVPVARSEGLSVLFEGIAREIQGAYELKYTSVRPSTKDVEVDIVATVGERQASAPIVYANPRFGQLGTSGELKMPQVRDNPMLLMGAVALAFLAVALVTVGIIAILTRPKGNLAQLKYYDQLRSVTQAENASVTNVVRERIVDAVDYVAGKRGLTRMVALKLEQAGLPLRPAEYMSAHIVAVVGVGFVTQLLLGRFVLSMLIIIIATVVPIAFLGYLVDRRRTRFEEQLPDILSMLAGSLRGGWGIQQAIDLVVTESMPPACHEFKRVQTETRLGMTLEQALQGMAERMNSDDFRAVVTAIAIQREVGGNLAEVLDLVAGTVRERASLRRQIVALTAEGRLSAIILIALPIIEGVALTLISPDYLIPLYTTMLGGVISVAGVVLMIVGSYWLVRVTKIEV